MPGTPSDVDQNDECDPPLAEDLLVAAIEGGEMGKAADILRDIAKANSGQLVLTHLMADWLADIFDPSTSLTLQTKKLVVINRRSVGRPTRYENDPALRFKEHQLIRKAAQEQIANSAKRPTLKAMALAISDKFDGSGLGPLIPYTVIFEYLEWMRKHDEV